MSAFLVTRGMGGQVVASYGMGPALTGGVDPEEADDWNIVASDLREKDQPLTILSAYTNLSKKTL